MGLLAIRPFNATDLRDCLAKLRLRFNTKSLRRYLAYVVVATLVHHIWIEKVRRRCENLRCSKEVRFKPFEIDVRLQLHRQVNQRGVTLEEKILLSRWGIELGDNGRRRRYML